MKKNDKMQFFYYFKHKKMPVISFLKTFFGLSNVNDFVKKDKKRGFVQQKTLKNAFLTYIKKGMVKIVLPLHCKSSRRAGRFAKKQK